MVISLERLNEKVSVLIAEHNNLLDKLSELKLKEPVNFSLFEVEEDEGEDYDEEPLDEVADETITL